MAELTLTREQVQALAREAEKHGVLYVEQAGPLLSVRIYVQAVFSSGYTYLYFNKSGKRVDA